MFCGNKPERKNNEHIIPKWLIELTGDPNRKISIGAVWDSKLMNFGSKKFAFDQFQFPSCESCNSRYSELELNAKNVVLCMLSDGALSGDDFLILFDWLDKVRVGLWLAFNYLQKNALGIDPNFHIANRIGNSDRLVFIYKADSNERGVNFSGVNVPAFQYYPVCFNLRINNYCLFNVSTDYLISKHLGLPYSKEAYYTEGRAIKLTLSKGTGRVLHPLVRTPYNKECTEIYQPASLKPKLMDEYSNLYDNDYSRFYLQDSKEGVSKILIAVKNRVVEYSQIPSKEWIPKQTWKLSELMKMIGKQVLDFQIYLLNRGPKYDEISLDKKKIIKLELTMAKQVNKMLSKALEDDKIY